MAMTATSTRSTRRAEGPIQRATRHHNINLNLNLNHNNHNHALNHNHSLLQQQQPNSGRPLKRLHEATNLAYNLKPAKKTKFEIEIPSKSQYQARLCLDPNSENHPQHRPARRPSVTATHNNPPGHDALSRQPTADCPPYAPESTPTLRGGLPAPPPAPAAAPPTYKTTAKGISGNRLTKHNQKVVNGIKHELDRLQPSSADMANSNAQGRKLRSQEGVRYKSELSAYFPEYDEVIGNIPKEHRAFISQYQLSTCN